MKFENAKTPTTILAATIPNTYANRLTSDAWPSLFGAWIRAWSYPSSTHSLAPYLFCREHSTRPFGTVQFSSMSPANQLWQRSPE